MILDRIISQGQNAVQQTADTVRSEGEKAAENARHAAEAASAAPQDTFERNQALTNNASDGSGAMDRLREAWSFLASDETRGNTIGVDDATDFRSFGYGEHGDTLGEAEWTPYSERTEHKNVHIEGIPDSVRSVETHEVGAKARAFGLLDGERLRAMIGVEGQAGLEEGVGLAYQGTELGTANLKEEVWVGLGAEVDAGVGVDLEKREIGAHAEGGVALGLGGKLGVGVTLGGEDFDRDVLSA